MNASSILGSISLSLGLIIAIYLIYIAIQQRKNSVTRSYGSGNKTKDYLQMLYLHLIRNRITKKYLLEIRKRFQIASANKEYELREKSVKAFLLICFLSSIVIIGFAVTSKSFLTLLFVILIIMIVSETIIDILVVSVENKLMNDQIALSKKLVKNYYKYKNILEALQISAEDLQETHKEISYHAMTIYEILTSKDTEQRIQDYNYSAPNKYLKQLLSLIFIASEYGDSIDDNGRSQLMANLGTLDEDIRLEVFKREKIGYFFRSLNVIPLVPLLFMNPFKTWAMNTFYPLGDFYNGTGGIIVETIMYVITILSYLGIRNLQKLDGNYQPSKVRASNQKVVKVLLKYLVPMEYTSRHLRKEKLIKESGEQVTIYEHYTRRILCSVGFVILSIVVIFILHREVTRNILYEPDVDAVQETFLGAKLSDEDMAIAIEITEFDRTIINAVKRTDDLDVIKKTIKTNYELTGSEVNIAALRISQKIKILNDQYFKWYELLVIIVLAWIGYQVPDIMLIYQKRLLKVEIENEVGMYQMIILMLMHIERINVEDILEWLSSYSRLFKTELELCLTEYDSGPQQALEKLSKSVEYEGFKDLVDSLISAVDSLSIKASFEALEAEKTHFFRMREEANNRSIESKKGGGSLIGFLPVYTFLAVYFGFPLLYVGITESQNYFSQLVG